MRLRPLEEWSTAVNDESIKFIQSVLPRGRTVYRGYPDRHALLILTHALASHPQTVRELKQSSFAPLLNRPLVKSILASAGNAQLCADMFREVWPEYTEPFRLTLGQWPLEGYKPDQRWDQITRDGWNLVLQLNFSASHIRKLNRLVSNWTEAIDESFHPIAANGELTLAWARIDLDLDTGEALIEEIQSDWVRDARGYARNQDAWAWKTYFDKVLLPETKRWAETMLTATLWFLLEEIGIKTIFYHTYETGVMLKNMESWLPPRSLYTELPRKFCFEFTHNGPRFIRDTAGRKLKNAFVDPNTKWNVLDFS